MAGKTKNSFIIKTLFTVSNDKITIKFCINFRYWSFCHARFKARIVQQQWAGTPVTFNLPRGPGENPFFCKKRCRKLCKKSQVIFLNHFKSNIILTYSESYINSKSINNVNWQYHQIQWAPLNVITVNVIIWFILSLSSLFIGERPEIFQFKHFSLVYHFLMKK